MLPPLRRVLIASPSSEFPFQAKFTIGLAPCRRQGQGTHILAVENKREDESNFDAKANVQVHDVADTLTIKFPIGPPSIRRRQSLRTERHDGLMNGKEETRGQLSAVAPEAQKTPCFYLCFYHVHSSAGPASISFCFAARLQGSNPRQKSWNL